MAAALKADACHIYSDVDGVYTADPKVDSTAEFIPATTARELIDRKLSTLPIEHAVLDLLTKARLARSVRLINGLTPGNLTRALEGEAIGSLIRQ